MSDRKGVNKMKKSNESRKTTNQSQMEHQSFTQTEMTEYYRLTTSELTDGILRNKLWTQSTRQIWRSRKTTGKLNNKKKMPSIRKK